MDLYKSIAWELGLSTERNRAALFKQIRTEVSRLCAENRVKPVLIIDEAHHLRTDLLEDMRLLTNYAMDSENRLTVVLVGHPELRRRMGMAALDALAQRIVVRANVRGIARDEMGAYLAHRLKLAGSRAAPLRAAHRRGDLPGLQRTAPQGQQPRAPLPLRRRHRQGKDRHHRAPRRRAARARLNKRR